MRKYFSENHVISSPKLNEHQKKGLRRKFKCFFLPKLGEDRKKKKRKKNLCRKLKWFFANFGEELRLFRLIIQRSNLDGGHLNLDGGTLTLGGGTRPPCNLSTVRNQRWARSPPFGGLEDQDQIIEKSDLENQRSYHANTLILKIKITLLLVLKER